MRIADVGLLFTAVSMLVGCASERTVFHSPDGKNGVLYLPNRLLIEFLAKDHRL
jgi:hypothetical protein